MWEARIDTSADRRIQRFSILRQGRRIRYSDALIGWRNDESFRDFFCSLLAEASFNAYYWETPPVTSVSVTRAFECVLVESELLAGVAPDPVSFAQYFRSSDAENGVVAFANLGGDATLVAPCPGDALGAYTHVAAFSRQAPRWQQHALWQTVAEAIEIRLAIGSPVWVSTAGQGVFWLHVRLDDHPKYYNYLPYKKT
jgi:hypothetical protein